MTPEERTDRVLAQVAPIVAERVAQVIAAMAALGHPMVPYSGLRTTQEQQALFAKGRTLPGPIVTHCDGVAKRSRHQGGLAVDCAFVVRGGTSEAWGLSWTGPWEAYGACAEAVGLIWGGRWQGVVDKPHIEYREG